MYYVRERTDFSYGICISKDFFFFPQNNLKYVRVTFLYFSRNYIYSNMDYAAQTSITKFLTFESHSNFFVEHQHLVNWNVTPFSFMLSTSLNRKGLQQLQATNAPRFYWNTHQQKYGFKIIHQVSRNVYGNLLSVGICFFKK